MTSGEDLTVPASDVDLCGETWELFVCRSSAGLRPAFLCKLAVVIGSASVRVNRQCNLPFLTLLRTYLVERQDVFDSVLCYSLTK